MLACAACAGAVPDVRHYDCERGGALQVTIVPAGHHGGDAAVLRFDGRRYRLQRAAAGRGERWAGDGVLLWFRDAEASVTIGDQVLAWGCTRR